MARRAVRRSLCGRGWPGQTVPSRFIVQNVFYDGIDKHDGDGGEYMIDPPCAGGSSSNAASARAPDPDSLRHITCGDPAPGLTDEEYLAYRPWHQKAMLPGHPEPDQYRVGQTNLYNIHNSCTPSFRVGRILLAADTAHACNRTGGYGCISARCRHRRPRRLPHWAVGGPGRGAESG